VVHPEAPLAVKSRQVVYQWEWPELLGASGRLGWTGLATGAGTRPGALAGTGRHSAEAAWAVQAEPVADRSRCAGGGRQRGRDGQDSRAACRRGRARARRYARSARACEGDKIDAKTLADLLVAGLVPAVWIGDERVRMLRRLVARRRGQAAHPAARGGIRRMGRCV